MVMKTKVILVCSLIICLVAGCVSLNNPVQIPVISTSISQPSTSPTLFIQETPTITLTPTFIVPTFEAVPTFGTNEAFGILRNYLKNQIPCQLPCWLGITPGKSTTLEVKKQLVEFSGISEKIYFGQVSNDWIVGNLNIKVNEGDNVIAIGSHYLTKTNNETVLSASFTAFPYHSSRDGHIYADEDYNNLLFEYKLPQIVKTYGLPAQTIMSAEIGVAEPTSPDYFIMRVLYPELGIFLKYEMPVETKEITYKFCVSEAIIGLEVISQEYHKSYREFFKETDEEWEWATSAVATSYYKSVKDAIGIGDKDFYNLLLSSPNQCFESPINIWPEP